MFHRETDASKVARNREAIFDLHARALAWMQDYTGIAYPFGKFDFVLIPAFQFSGMEHAGAIYYNASTLLLDESATQNQLLNRANTIAHETAHMWFGDLVTMKWFNDVWMKEVFANFMAAKIVNPSFPGVNHELRFLLQNYPAAYDVDRTAGANPIRQSLDNLNEAGSLYGAIIYQKAPIVMRQLEALIGRRRLPGGPAGVPAALRSSRTRPGPISSACSTRARRPIWRRGAARGWTSLDGRWCIRTCRSTGGRIEQLTLRQEDPRGRNIVWPQKLQIAFGGSDAVEDPDHRSRRRRLPFREATGVPAPRWILPLGGYGSSIWTRPRSNTCPSRSAMWPTRMREGRRSSLLWEAMLEGQHRTGRGCSTAC